MKRFLRVGSIEAARVGLFAVGRDADPRRHAGPTVVYERVEGMVRVLRDEIARPRAEADEPTVAADHSTERRRTRLVTGGGDVDPFRQTRAAVEDEHVGLPVPVPVDEVRGVRAECDDESRGHRSTTLRCDPATRRTGQRSRASFVPSTLSVTKTSIVPLSSAGTRFEASDENTIVRPSALTSAARLAASASPSRPDAHALGESRGAIAHEHIRHAVPIVRHEVGRRGRERDDAPVRADRRLHARPIALRAGRTRCSPARCAALRGRARRRRSRRSGRPGRATWLRTRRQRSGRSRSAPPRTSARPPALPSRAQVRATHAENDVFGETCALTGWACA